METFSLTTLYIILIVLIIVSGFFSGSETGMTAINRYRLRHLARSNNPAAIRVSKLLERLDRLLGVILIGNTAANVFAASVATVIGFRVFPSYGGSIASVILTLVILIFAEITPKTLAANYPLRIAFFASIPLKILLKIFYPLVWTCNHIANGLLRLFRFTGRRQVVEHLTPEELSTLLREAGGNIPDEHQDMLIAILELEKVTVEDIMIPRSDIVGIDLDQDWSQIMKQLTTSQHTRIPVYTDDIDNIKGTLHLRAALNKMASGELNQQTLLTIIDEPLFIPEGTHLHTQLLNFRSAKKRVGLVVDEYGDIIGMATLEDILEEIVGEFTTDIAAAYKGVKLQTDGSYLVDGSTNLRDINRLMHWHFDTTGPKTLSGLIVEYLETIPEHKVCVRISGYPIEIVKVSGNTIKTARIFPKLRQLI